MSDFKAKLTLMGLRKTEQRGGLLLATFTQGVHGREFSIEVVSFDGLEIGQEYGVQLTRINSR